MRFNNFNLLIFVQLFHRNKSYQVHVVTFYQVHVVTYFWDKNQECVDQH